MSFMTEDGSTIYEQLSGTERANEMRTMIGREAFGGTIIALSMDVFLVLPKFLRAGIDLCSHKPLPKCALASSWFEIFGHKPVLMAHRDISASMTFMQRTDFQALLIEPFRKLVDRINYERGLNVA